MASGPALKAPKDIIPYLTNLEDRSVLFVDEIADVLDEIDSLEGFDRTKRVEEAETHDGCPRIHRCPFTLAKQWFLEAMEGQLWRSSSRETEGSVEEGSPDVFWKGYIPSSSCAARLFQTRAFSGSSIRARSR